MEAAGINEEPAEDVVFEDLWPGFEHVALDEPAGPSLFTRTLACEQCGYPHEVPAGFAREYERLGKTFACKCVSYKTCLREVLVARRRGPGGRGRGGRAESVREVVCVLVIAENERL